MTKATEIVFILDRSGSMSNLVSDTIGGFNQFIEKQKLEKGKANLTTILFDNLYEILHNNIDIKSVEKLTNKEYYARGSTALLDAIGKSINNLSEKLKLKKNKPNIIFVITTDGYENSSVEFTNDTIKTMIENKTKNENWQFLFLGANINSFSVGGNLGINPTFTSNFTANTIGTQSLYDGVTKAVSQYRSAGTISQDWADNIQ